MAARRTTKHLGIAAGMLAGFLFDMAPARAEPGWTFDRDKGCRIWDDNPSPGWSVTWTGPCVEGMGHGRGVVQLYDRAGVAESRYDGDLRAGRMHGYGVYVWRNGQRYDGELRNGNFHGRGTMTWPNGDRYEGLWADDLAHGFGVKTTASGQTFGGQWDKGCFRHGERWAVVRRTAEQCGFR
jgi:hypothetical protein